MDLYLGTDGIKETAIHYTVEEVQTEATNAFYGQVTESDDGKTTTILNKKKDQEDKPFIEVTKTFEGLTKTQIQELANSENPYTITLIHTDTNTSKTLIMNAGKLNDILQSNDNKKVWTYTWKLEDCLDGTYKVSESNYGKDGYDVTVTVNGQQVTNWNDFSVSTKQATIEEYKQSENTTTCSPKTFSIGKVNLIVAKLTANEGYFVWTNTPVSISERKEIVKLINDKIDGIKGIGFDLQDGDEDYSGEYELMSADRIRRDLIDMIPHYKESPLVQKAIADMEKYLDEKHGRVKETEHTTETVIGSGQKSSAVAADRRAEQEPASVSQSQPQKAEPVGRAKGEVKKSVLQSLKDFQARAKAQEQNKTTEKSKTHKKGEVEL